MVFSCLGLALPIDMFVLVILDCVYVLVCVVCYGIARLVEVVFALMLAGLWFVFIVWLVYLLVFDCDLVELLLTCDSVALNCLFCWMLSVELNVCSLLLFGLGVDCLMLFILAC